MSSRPGTAKRGQSAPKSRPHSARSAKSPAVTSASSLASQSASAIGSGSPMGLYPIVTLPDGQTSDSQLENTEYDIDFYWHAKPLCMKILSFQFSLKSSFLDDLFSFFFI